VDKIIRVDVTTRKVIYESVTDEYAKTGGRGLIAKIMLNEVDPMCDPLGQHNKLIIANGFLTGTNVSSASRLCIGGKSPLTGGIKESNSGGTVAMRIAQLGFKGIIIEGEPSDNHWYYLKIGENGCSFEEADNYVGLGTYEFTEKILQAYPKASVACIGPAGERLYRASGIATTDINGVPSRFCGRGGLGAVMGSKKIKAIVVTGKGKIIVADKERFKTALIKYSQIIKDAPSSKAYRTLGTPGMTKHTNDLGGLPVNNFSKGRFNDVDKISGEALFDLIEKRGGEGKNSHPCMPGCLIQCSNIFPDDAGKMVVSPFEYETIILMGPNIGISDFDVIAKLNYQCNDLGLDTIDTGVAIGIALDGGMGNFGDANKIFDLINEIKYDTLIGKMLGNGAKITGDLLGVRKVPVVKGQAMPAYDPRAIKGMGVTFATSAMGADHTYGPTARAVYDHAGPSGHVEESEKMQKSISIFDTAGFCYFVMGAIGNNLETVVDLINARYGWNYNVDWLINVAIETLENEQRFNKLAGFSKVHNRLPEYFMEHKIPSTNTVFDVSGDELDNLVAYDEK
jgi:aldehyde:ferredoxin oxidoreductase